MVERGSQPETNEPLPRGRHRLTQEQVASHQRERIAAATAAAISGSGYRGLTVEQVIKEAGVSRSTFYVHFSNMREAVLAAHSVIFERFLAGVRAACEGQPEWPQKVGAAVGATVDFAADLPELTQILLLGSLIGDAALSERISESHDRLAALLSQVRPHSPNADELPDCTERFLVAAISAVVARQLVQGDPEHLRAVRAELVELTLIPFFGGAEAARLAGKTA